MRARDGPRPASHLGMHIDVDASRDAMSTILFFITILFYFLPTSSVRGGWGGGGACAARFSLFVLFFHVQVTTSGTGHRVKWFSRAGNHYAERQK